MRLDQHIVLGLLHVYVVYISYVEGAMLQYLLSVVQGVIVTC